MSVALLLVLATLRVLTLAEAVQTALTRQPQIQQAQASLDVAKARVGEARSAVLPQLSGSASYQRTTSNFVARPGIVPNQTAMVPTTPSWNTFDFWSFSVTLSQYLFDFRAPFVWGATAATARAQASTVTATRQQVALNVRAAYFNARAQKALAGVARDNLTNQGRHLAQIRGFAEAGVRPEIDVAQAETDYANAEVLLINANNAYEIAKAQLNQAMGLEGDTDYDIADDVFPPVEGEDLPVDTLVHEGVQQRPDLASLEQQVRAQKKTVNAARGGYGPTFSASMTLSDVGTSLGNLTWNWNAMVSATWTPFDGLFTYSLVNEAKANLRVISSQRDAVRLQVVLDVTQARLQVVAAKQTLRAAEKAVTSARMQLALAEGRYSEGLGNVIELGDAQLTSTQTAAQRVQAQYNLAIARAQLLRALGRL